MTQRHPTAIIYLVPAFIMATKQIIFRGGGESQLFAFVIHCTLIFCLSIGRCTYVFVVLNRNAILLICYAMINLLSNFK